MMFDPDDLMPTEDLKHFRARVNELAREKIAPQASLVDEEEFFNRQVESLLWEQGLLTLTYPEAYGGMPQYKTTALCIAVEEIAKYCASSALLLIIQAVGSFPIIHGGSQALKEKYLPQMSEGRKLVAYLVTEPSSGSDVAGIQTMARRVGDRYRIKGNKCFATNGGVAELYSVLARTSPERGQCSFFLVERGYPGLSIGRTERKLGQRGSNTTEVFLDDVEVPAEHLLGAEGEGFLIAMKDFDMSRPAIGAQALGIAEGALQTLLDVVKDKRQGGSLARELPIVQSMVAESAMLIEASRGLIYRAARMNDEGWSNTKLASMAKCFAADAAMRITTEMIDAFQMLNGFGSMKASELDRMFRDAKLTQIFEGTNQIQRLVIGRQVLKEHLGRSIKF